jgi:SAM-dependent methyltransferase
MIEIAQGEAAREGFGAAFETGDYETLDLGRRFDACLLYDALHHSEDPELVFPTARRALKAGGRLLLVEPNWLHRFRGRGALRFVRDDRTWLQRAAAEKASTGHGICGRVPLSQQPQEALLEHGRGHGCTLHGAPGLPPERIIPDADLVTGPSDLITR